MNPLYVLGLGLAFFLTSKGEEETCDPDIQIVGGWVTKSKGNEPKSVAKFECPDSHYPSPVSSSKCQNGRWSHTQRRIKPICKEFRCPAPVLEEGIFTPVNLSYAIGETVSFECYDGYALKGSESRTCMKNGRWNGSNAICTSGLQDCPHPGVPAGGRKAGTSYDIGDSVQYYCNDGLVLVGSSKRRCLESEEWTGAAPTCQHPNSFDIVEDVAESFTASLISTMGRSRAGDSKTPAPSLARKIYLGKNADLHMYFMIDASDSVGEENFNQAITVVKNLTDKIASFDIRPRFGVVTYASKPIRVINLNEEDRSGADAVVDILENDELAKYDAHLDQRGTNIYAALHEVYEMMSFSKQSFQRTWEKIRFVTILFTDGKSNMGPNPRIAVDRIENFVRQQNKTEDYLDMYAFGISDEVDSVELNNLASKKNDEKHSFMIRDTTELVNAFDKILDLNTLGDLCGVADERPDAKIREKHPWHVYINIPKSLAHGGTLETGSCSGSIVAPGWILTAAHCFTKVENREMYKDITVTLGENKIIRVKELFIHPNFMIAAK
ncbi:complement C2-like [Pristis pectinata]|uniref:complement C2-like n=1 Tax=Pristis pectinata TaxID=685728 RepID=UPI00223DD6B2|nr:complement C2-like [Pristis pectinata]